MATKAECNEQTVLLTNEQGKQYFSQDVEMQSYFDDPDVVCEIRINVEEKTLQYRVGKESQIGSATWMDDDFEGGVDVLYYIDVWDTEKRRIGHKSFHEYKGIDFEVYKFPGVGYRVDVIFVNGHDEEISTFDTSYDALDAIDQYYLYNPEA